MTPSAAVREALDDHLPTFSTKERVDYYQNIMSLFDSIVRERNQYWEVLQIVLPAVLAQGVRCPHGCSIEDSCAENTCSWNPVRKTFLNIYR